MSGFFWLAVMISGSVLLLRIVLKLIVTAFDQPKDFLLLSGVIVVLGCLVYAVFSGGLAPSSVSCGRYVECED